MLEKAKITQIEGEKLSLEVLAHQGCSGCSSCGKGKSRQAVVVVDDPENYSKGDEINICISSGLMFKAYSLLYGVPLFVFLAVVIIGYAVSESASLAFFSGLLFMSGTLVGVNKILSGASVFNPEIRKTEAREY